MKTFLCLLSVAGLLAFATTGCQEEQGGSYGPEEYQYGYYDQDWYRHDGYWDRGRYYYRPYNSPYNY